MRKPKEIVQWRFAFLAIILITANTRFIGIENSPISPSEATIYFKALVPISVILLSFSFATSQDSSFFTLILHYWISLLGKSEAALRALPALFSFLALFPFFGISRILFNKRIAYTALALYAFSPGLTIFAQELSPYSLFLFFSLVSTWSLLMAI